MSDFSVSMIVIGAIAAFILITAGIIYLFYWIIDVFHGKKEKKFAKEHPKWTEFLAKYQEERYKKSEYWYEEIAHRKDRIDKMLNELKYLPIKKREEKEKEVEHEREELDNAKTRLEEMRKALDTMWQEANVDVDLNKFIEYK